MQSGTFVAHPLSLACGLAFLDAAEDPELWRHLQQLQDYLYPRLEALFRERGMAVRMQHAGSRFSLYFGLEEPVRNYREYARQDRPMLLRFFGEIISAGVYTLAQGHHGINGAFTIADLDRVLEAFDQTICRVKAKGV